MICLAWLPCVAALAQDAEAPPAPETWRIGALRLHGFEAIGAAQAQAVMETKLPPVFSLREGPPLDIPQLDRDRLHIRQLYQENGFFGAEIDYEIERNADTGAAIVTFIAKEGRPALVSEVQVVLTDAVTEGIWGKRLREKVSTRAGQAFNLSRYEQDKAALGQVLANDSHPVYRLDGQVRVYPAEERVVIVFQVDPGPRILFGPVVMTGKPRRDAGFILRQIPFVRGQPFNQAELARAQRTILDTGFYSTVNLNPDFDHVQDGQVPITLEVKEAKHHSMRMGLGWGNEDQFRLRILQVNRDMLGLNDTLTFEGKISYIYMGLIGRLKLPELPSRLTDTVITGGVEQKENEAFTNRRFFVNPMFEYRLQEKWSWFLGYNVEKDRMVELKAAVPDPEAEKRQLYISSVPVGLKYDSRDSLLDAKRGTLFQLDVETASDAIGSEVEFFRPQAEVRHVDPLPRLPGWFLASRAKAGLAYPLPGTDRVPLVRRFFIGGADSVRGYAYQSLGPLDSGGKPLGGEAMFEASVELRFPLWGDLGGVTFVDAGNAYESVTTEMGALRYTSGVGLRYQTPVGPIRLDFGYQLNPPDNSPLSRYEVYLSVGQAF